MDLAQGLGAMGAFIASSGVLSAPLVLVDVGARGGIHERWNRVAPALAVYGFDPSVTIETTPTQRFSRIAIGDRDGTIQFRYAPNPYESQIDPTSTDTVPIARLDTLFAAGRLPPADFIKIDVEGFEPAVLDGAKNYLAASPLLGADIETNFNTSPILPEGHLHAVTVAMRNAGLRLADLAVQSPANHPSLAWPGVCNALFCRDIIDSLGDAQQLLKLLIVLDVYGMTGHSAVLIERHRATLAEAVDTVKLTSLCRPQRRVPIERYFPHLGFGIWTRVKAMART